MKKLLLLACFAAFVVGCGNKGNGELTGVQGREEWYQPDPFGMLFIPMGAFQMGPDDDDVPFAHTTKQKTVSVQAFYIDDTEISNNEYRQFVNWVRDSMAYRLLIDNDAETYGIAQDEYGQDIDPPLINWEAKIKWNEQESREVLEPLYLPQQERFYNRREVDTRRLNYEYYWIDYKTASQKQNRFIPEKSQDKNGKEYLNGKGSYTVNGRSGLDRSVFIIKEVVNVFPDTLAWIHDFTYSFNEPMTQMYFWHPAYDDYPVVGVNWKQAKAFCVWRTNLLNSYLNSIGGAVVNDFRLPTETEWEYSSRGGLALSPYPWGGPYIRNARGCFLGNFKPMRGSYIDDGGFHTVRIFSYNPNDYGLYCMAGNVSEWTSNAYDESAYDFSHDLNPNYEYAAQDNDPTVLKRKVIRGGSWKDVGYYMQTSSRSYEYQDTAKCYVGFRCVMTYLGRAKDDNL
ncbi:MAG: SUMF1/EgtB/PvdO family nonheme iron enzyme [Bacteroidetes bacterium]|nr:SUMF1/EgtB/PvdO family nonheme iron enzyme [Bacteroidota bacterium]